MYMAEAELETRVLKKVDIPFVIIGKYEIFNREKYIISCQSKDIDNGFRFKVSKSIYCRVKQRDEYILKDEPIMQKYDEDGNPSGGTFIYNPSNLFWRTFCF